MLANAGIGDLEAFTGTVYLKSAVPLEPNLKALQVDLIGPIYTSRLAMWYFHNAKIREEDNNKQQSLIFTASMAAFTGVPQNPMYSASKAYG